MLRKPFANSLVLTGPTGSGKTSLALEIAERLGAEIIAMDSMTLYRGMDIGTAKPTAEERRRVPHHLIDVLDPWESANVAWWLKAAERCCREIESRAKRVLFVGGTALYLKALLHGLFEGPPADESLRLRLQGEAQVLGHDVLHDRLAQVDPVSAARLHPHDLRRVIRALEVWELSGKAMSHWQQQSWWGETETAHPNADGPDDSVLWLDVPREELYARINHRVAEMVRGGLVEEVRRLQTLAAPMSKEARKALAYGEIIEHLDGKRDLPETIELIRKRTRNYAKRQLTWFRNTPACRAVRWELTFSSWGLTIDG